MRRVSYPLRPVITLSCMAIFLTSCAWMGGDSRPASSDKLVELPSRWKMENEKGDGATQPIPAKWWSVFGDNYLSSLVTLAMRDNLDIKASVERINAARAAVKIAGATLLPSADATASAGREYTNPSVGATTTNTNLSAGLTIAYDLDLFGGNQARVDAAMATMRETEYAKKVIELATSADVTEAYFNLLLTRERLSLGEENLKTARDLLNVVEKRVKVGVDSQLELSQQKVAVANAEAGLSALKQAESSYIHAIAILLGKPPQTAEVSGGTLATIIPPVIAAGQPSALLERRPDIAVMEQKLVAANADIQAARAAFYPSITLGVTPAVTGIGLSDPLGVALGAVANLTTPIFAGGRLEGGVEQATAAQRELLANYQKIVLIAFGEVENALSAVQQTTAQSDALKTAVDEARKAYTISSKRYDVGTIDFATLLKSQADKIAADDAYAQALKARLSASLDLVKALGGGWKAPVSADL